MSKTLLLADDSVTIQKVVGISFANEDVKLVTVDNGDDALVKARELQPDIVLADVVMPGMNGYEVCEAIRADPALRSIPVLLLTGTFEAFDEERAARAGADGHITKPFEAQALVDQVNARLAAAAASRKVEPEAPSPAPAAASAPAESSPFDSGFDFLQEEETTEPSGIASADHGSTTVLLQDDLDVEPDEAFGFEAPDHVHAELSVSADLSSSLPEEPMPTVQRMDPARAMVPDSEEDSLFGDDGLHEAETMPPVGLEEPPAAPPARRHDEDATRVVVNPAPASVPRKTEREDAFASVMPSDLGGEAVLDPTGARDYDVSSSDLGDLMAAGPDGDETPPLRATSGTAPAPIEEDPALGESFAAAELEPDLSPHAAEPSVAAVRPAAVPAPRSSAAAPRAGIRPAPESRSAPTTTGGPRVAPSSLGDLSPEAQRQLHDALEKAAWEAFGDVTERLVREAVSRIEQVAWEVIPQMAETVIREEIRKLKEES